MEPLRVIASTRRLQILRLVWDTELSAGQIAAEFDVTWGAVSQHLTVLKGAGLLSERRDGNSRFYLADKAALGTLRAIVEYQWRSSLNRLTEAAEAEQREKGQQMTSSDVFEVSVHIDAAPETVFGFFTDPTRYTQRMGQESTIEAVPGGVYRARMRDGVEASGQFVEIDPPQRVVFTWGEGDAVVGPRVHAWAVGSATRPIRCLRTKRARWTDPRRIRRRHRMLCGSPCPPRQRQPQRAPPIRSRSSVSPSSCRWVPTEHATWNPRRLLDSAFAARGTALGSASRDDGRASAVVGTGVADRVLLAAGVGAAAARLVVAVHTPPSGSAAASSTDGREGAGCREGSRRGAAMHAGVGDRLRVHSRVVGTPDQILEIIEVRGRDGAPPYRVRREDGHQTLMFPGPDASVEHPQHREGT